MKRIILLIVFMLVTAASSFAAQQLPGKGIKVQPARATWNTGYFQEERIAEPVILSVGCSR